MNMHHKTGLEAITPTTPKILILGSIPGDKSIEMQHYYAHPRNRFWNIMALELNETLPQDYNARVEMLIRHNIALWDVAHKAEREGSLDSAIRNPIPNDLDAFLNEYPSIRAIAFNGNKAKEMYRQFFKKLPYITYFDLPSTSPANAAYSLDRLCKSWEPLFEVLRKEEK